MQTLALARLLGGEIVAVDTHQPFLDELRGRAREAGVADRVQTLKASMDALPFRNGSFNLVWSEGAISCMGFQAGLLAWRRLLAPRGLLVVSEITWLNDAPPAQAREFWKLKYPAMQTEPQNTAAAKAAGYRVRETYRLPSEAWFSDYYDHLEKQIERLAEKYRSDEEAVAEITAEREEIDLFRRYSDAYAYLFYILELSSSSPEKVTHA
ncbi:MAG: class I SAM-dependent methyltransferase [Candidatus Baltobacteraceae bacterium]